MTEADAAPPIVSIRGLGKTYAGGHVALRDVDLDIRKGEILALLGPNGAGKTTLISIVCGIVKPSAGVVLVDGHDVVTDFRASRALVGLVPQEIMLEPFETPTATAAFSRGLFGRPRNPALVADVLARLSLADKAKEQIRTLSGGMKRRVMIAKALAHEPAVLFLDEPTAGVDVSLRKSMWAVVRELRDRGVTIILTTHYIDEAEAMADRIGVISGGRLLLVEETAALMRRMGRKALRIELHEPCAAIPESLSRYDLTRAEDGLSLTYAYEVGAEHTGITGLLQDLREAGLRLRDVATTQSSLEDIFVDLVGENA